MWTAMRGGGDPGYADTSRILAEVGTLLATETMDGGALSGRRGGVLTPAAAFGDVILPRLEPHGITYTVTGMRRRESGSRSRNRTKCRHIQRET